MPLIMGCMVRRIDNQTSEFPSVVMNENKENVISMIIHTYHQLLVLKVNEENSFVV